MLESSINKEWNEKRLLQMESAEGFVEEEAAVTYNNEDNLQGLQEIIITKVTEFL